MERMREDENPPLAGEKGLLPNSYWNRSDPAALSGDGREVSRTGEGNRPANERKETMDTNKAGMRRLFAPSALMATVATGMLVFSTVTALAGWYTVSARSAAFFTPPPQECPTTYCEAYCRENGHMYYWCCSNYPDSCPDHQGTLVDCNPWDPPEYLLGYCFE